MANKSQFQKYAIETVHRSDIKNADYNPRKISPNAKKKLQEALKDHGLVEPIIWNKQTGNLVGGHQRLEQLDALEGTDDYSLDVAVIAVDEREEAIINVQLNNPNLQGEWDIDKLADLKIGLDIDFKEFGFEDIDIDYLFDGEDRFTELFYPEEVEKTVEQIQAVRDARNAGKAIMEEENNGDFFAMITFINSDAKAEFYKKINVPVYERVLTVDQLERLSYPENQLKDPKAKEPLEEQDEPDESETPENSLDDLEELFK